MRRLAGAAALCLLAGCATYSTKSTLDATAVGMRGAVPDGFASGATTATWMFGLGPFGSEDPQKAIDRARGQRLETTLTDVTVERRVTCVPGCGFAMFKSVRVVVSGSLVKPTGYKDPPRPPAKEEGISWRAPEPSPANLTERLVSYYKTDPADAQVFYESLKPETRAEITRYVLSGMGLSPAHGDEFRARESSSKDECRFLKWYLHEHTTYRLSGQTCSDLE
jgi:hypothetical protein